MHPAASAGPTFRVTMDTGVVPGRDGGDDADRLMHNDKALVGPGGGNGLAIDPLCLFREPQQEIRRILHFRHCGAKRFALLFRHGAREVILTFDHQLPGAVENGGAVVCRRGGPGGK